MIDGTWFNISESWKPMRWNFLRREYFQDRTIRTIVLHWPPLILSREILRGDFPGEKICSAHRMAESIAFICGVRKNSSDWLEKSHPYPTGHGRLVARYTRFSIGLCTQGTVDRERWQGTSWPRMLHVWASDTACMLSCETVRLHTADAWVRPSFWPGRWFIPNFRRSFIAPSRTYVTDFQRNGFVDAY